MSKEVSLHPKFVPNTQLHSYNSSTHKTPTPQYEPIDRRADVLSSLTREDAITIGRVAGQAAVKSYQTIKPVVTSINLVKGVVNQNPLSCATTLAPTVLKYTEIGERQQIMNDPYIQHMPSDPIEAVKYTATVKSTYNFPPIQNNSQSTSNNKKSGSNGYSLGALACNLF